MTGLVGSSRRVITSHLFFTFRGKRKPPPKRGLVLCALVRLADQVVHVVLGASCDIFSASKLDHDGIVLAMLLKACPNLGR